MTMTPINVSFFSIGTATRVRAPVGFDEPDGQTIACLISNILGKIGNGGATAWLRPRARVALADRDALLACAAGPRHKPVAHCAARQAGTLHHLHEAIMHRNSPCKDAWHSQARPQTPAPIPPVRN